MTQFQVQKVNFNHTLIFSIGPCNLIKYMFLPGYIQYESKNMFKGRDKNILFAQCNLYHICPYISYLLQPESQKYGTWTTHIYTHIFFDDFHPKIEITIIFCVYIVRICKYGKRTTNILPLDFHPKISFFSQKCISSQKYVSSVLTAKTVKYSVIYVVFMENCLFL